MRADGSLTFDTKIDTSGFRRGTINVQKQLDGLSGAVKKIGSAIASRFQRGVEASKKQLGGLSRTVKKYDGTIRINTQINTKQSQIDLATLENRIAKTSDKIASLRSKMDALKNAKIPTQEYKEVQSQIGNTEKKIDDLIEKQKRFLATGGKETSSAYKRMEYDLEKLKKALPYLQEKLQGLVDTGKAFTLGENTEEYLKLGKQLKYAENELSSLSKRHDMLSEKLRVVSGGYEEIGNKGRESFQKINGYASKTGDWLKKISGQIKKVAVLFAGTVGRSTTQATGSLNTLTSSVKKLGSVIMTVFAAKQIAQFGREAIKLGSDLQEVQNVVDVTFTTMADKVDKFAKSAAVSAGLSETMAKQYVGTFGAMAKSFGFAEKEAFDMSTTLTQLAGDVASFYNLSQEEAYYKLKPVFTGEPEPLKDLGVVMTQAALDQYALAKGMGKTTQQMTEQEKVALRYRFVVEQLSGASGDFLRTSDGWANQVRVLKLQFDSLKATIGQGLINVLTPVLKLINTLLGKLTQLAESFKAFTELITGNKATASKGAGLAGIDAAGAGQDTVPKLGDDYNTAASGAENLASATEDAAEATKEAEKAAKGYLSPLDTIHKIGKEDIEVPEIEKVKDKIGDTGGAGGAGNVAGVPVDYGELAKGQTAIDKLSDKFSGLYDLIKKKDWAGLGRSMASGINAGLRKIYDALDWNKIGPKITKTTDAFTGTVNSMVENIDWDLMGRVIGRGINLLAKTFNQITDPKTGINFEAIGRSLSTALRGMLAEVDWRELGNAIGNWFMISWNTFKGFVDDMWRTSDFTGLNGWQELGRSLAEGVEGLFEKIDFKKIGIAVAKAFNGIFETLKSFVLEMNNNGTWDKIAKNIYTGLNTMIHKIDWAENGRILSDFVVDLLGTIWKVAENTDWEGLGKGIGDFLSNINWGRIFGQVFAIIAEVVGGLIEGFGSTTAGKFVLAFGAVKLAIKGVNLVGAIKPVIDKLKILGTKATGAGKLAASSSVNWEVLAKAMGIVTAAMIGFKVGMKLTEVTTSANQDLDETRTYLSQFSAALVELANQDTLTAEQQVTLNNIISELADKGASPVEALTTLRDALSDAGISSSDLSTAAHNANVDLGDLVVALKDTESGGETTKTSLDKAGGAANTAGTDFESLAGKAQGTTSILNSLDTSPAQSNIESIQQSVDKVDFEKLSRNSETAIRNMNSVWNSNKLPIYNTVKEALIDNIQFDDLLKTKYSGYAAFSVEGYNNKIKELESETKTTMQSFVQKGVMDPVTGKLKINSPSKVFEGYGENIVSGLKNGIDNDWEGFSDWWGTKVSNILDKFKGIKKSFEEKGNEIISGIQTGVSEKWSELSDALTGKKNDIVNTFSNIREEMKSIGSNIISGIIDGLYSMWNNLTSWVGNIKDALTFNISSPFGGGGSYSVNAPIAYAEIPALANAPTPYLAQGAVIPPNAPFAAVLGDQKNGRNLEAPESLIRKIVREESGRNSGGNTYHVHVNASGRELLDIVLTEGELKRGRNGSNPFALGVT